MGPPPGLPEYPSLPSLVQLVIAMTSPKKRGGEGGVWESTLGKHNNFRLIWTVQATLFWLCPPARARRCIVEKFAKTEGLEKQDFGSFFPPFIPCVLRQRDDFYYVDLPAFTTGMELGPSVSLQARFASSLVMPDA